jgi:hypothetical protein
MTKIFALNRYTRQWDIENKEFALRVTETTTFQEKILCLLKCDIGKVRVLSISTSLLEMLHYRFRVICQCNFRFINIRMP